MRDLAAKFPNVVIAIDHAGFPDERTDEYFARWSRAMSVAAEADNIRCKISGLGMGDHNWTDGQHQAVRAPVHRDLRSGSVASFATNWPVDWLWSEYDAVVDAYTEIVSDFTDDEKTALFSANAEAIHRI